MVLHHLTSASLLSLKDPVCQTQLSNFHIMSEFQALSCEDVRKIIMQFPSKSCSLDSLPTWILKDNLHVLLPFITKIVNSSLISGVFPEILKQAIITPVLKKTNLDPNTLKHYRPVSNIKFISKIIEKAASCQVIDHVDSNNLGEKFQSSYKKTHSTESALLKVKNDLLQSIDDNKAVLVVLLDMSAAFDTVDHALFLQRLDKRFGIRGYANSWFKTYLENRTTKVAINQMFSDDHILKYSLPQGSIIGPQGFIMYTSPIGDIIRKHNICFHAYADDVQLYSEFSPRIAGDCERALSNLTACITELNSWMVQNKLQLNQDKTEFCIMASNRVLKTLGEIQLTLGDVIIRPSSSVKNLGVTFDASLSMSNHISSVCKTVNYHIRNLWRIRRFITQDACHSAVRALVLSRIDYANSLLYNVRSVDLMRLQRLQNKAARLVFACGRDERSVDLLTSLHWLPVKERILFKFILYVFKCMNNAAPSYLVDLVSLQSDKYTARGQRLRSSSDTTRLFVPRSRKRAGDSSFLAAAPKLWNALPVYLRESESVPAFRRALKTHLFPI